MDVKPYKIPHPYRKLNKNLVDAIVKDIEEGSTHRYASEANGITQRILNIWIKQGEVDVEHELKDSLCAYLVLSLAQIKQKEIKSCRKKISKNEKGHKGAEWTLEHAYWREYSPSAAVLEFAEEVEALKAKVYGESHDKEMDSESD